MEKIKKFDDFIFEQFVNDQFIDEAKEVQKSEVQKEVQAEVSELKPNMRTHYMKFFQDKLKKFGVKGIGQLGDRRSEFFKEIKAEWSKHKETIK